MLLKIPSEDGTKFLSILNNGEEVKQPHNFKSQKGQFSLLMMILVIQTSVQSKKWLIYLHRKDKLRLLRLLTQKIKNMGTILREEVSKERNF